MATTTQTLVKEVMTSDPVCIGPADSVREVARIFDDNEISGAPVANGQSQLIGVVSKTDILHRAVVGAEGSRRLSTFERLAEGLSSGTDLDPEDLGRVEDFMSPDPITATPDETVAAVARRMAVNSVHRVIVVDAGNHPVGIVTTLDVLRAFPL